jgi:Holliday junction resolvase
VLNAKRKGSRTERRARDLLYRWGALRVVKSGASLGEFDLLALFPGELICIQVKTNRWPSPVEMARIKDFPRLTYLKKLVFRYRDRVREPDVREV